VTPALDAAALISAFALAHSLDGSGWITIVLAFGLLRLHGGHGRRLDPAVSDELPMLIAAVCAAGIAGAAAEGFGEETGRLAQAAAIAAGLVVAARAIGYGVVRLLRRRGAGLEPTIVLGGGPVAAEIAETLQRSPQYGLRPVGFVDERNGRDLSLPFLGPIGELPRIVDGQAVTRLVVAFGPGKEEDLIDVLRAWDEMPLDIYIVPRLFELGVGADGNADEVNGIPLVKLHRVALRGTTWRLKRAVDATIAAAGLVVASPLLLILAAAVRLSSSGPVFFRQKRVGQRGRVIEILKFRTMLVNDDADTTWSVNGDARQTPIGRLLRATHLDELPQLISILKGDMSLVGPRPERPYYVDLFAAEIPRYKDRHRVPVGLTGWAQIHGLNGDTSIQDRARFDNRYIERWSLWRDLVILSRTGKAIFTGVATALRADKSAKMVDLRSQVIDLTEAQFSATLRNGNGHANGSTSANGHTDGATAHIHLDPIPSNGHTKEPAPDGTTSAT
jgi:exopolysaccharide biosynthesis polyprenyl glycosylphosphotransferase